MSFDFEALDGAPIDLSECDNLAIRKLLTAVFTEALTEARLTIEWAETVVRSERYALPLFNTAVNLLEAHAALSGFLRCKFGTELLDWLQAYTGEIDADVYWSRLSDLLDESRYGLAAAQKIMEKGAPPENRSRRVSSAAGDVRC